MNRDDSPMVDPSPRALRLRYAVHGPLDGPPLLVLHGITCTGRYWLPRLRPLASHHRLLVPDLPGYGDSPKPFVDYTMDFFVETMLGFIERSGVDGRRLPILGHSLGSLVALELAAREPALVERLVLLSTPCFDGPEDAHRVMLRGSSSYRSLLTVNSLAATLAQVRRTGWRLSTRYLHRLPWTVLADARKFTFRSLSSTLERCLMHYRVDDVLARCPADLPITLIHGDGDQIAPLASLRDLSAGPPRLDLHVIAGAGHHPFHTHTEDCLRIIRGAFAAGPGT